MKAAQEMTKSRRQRPNERVAGQHVPLRRDAHQRGHADRGDAPDHERVPAEAQHALRRREKVAKRLGSPRRGSRVQWPEIGVEAREERLRQNEACAGA